MKRNAFLKLLVTACSLVAVPFHLVSNALQRTGRKGIFIENGKDRYGKPLTLFGKDKFYCKVSTEDTKGDLYIFDSTREDEGGPPLHYHYDQDEWWYIISGEFLIKVGEETFSAKAGDSVFGPRGVPHTFAKVGKGEAKLIMLFQPAGRMEQWFSLVADGTVAKMSEEERANARKQHGFEHVGPPLTILKKP